MRIVLLLTALVSVIVLRSSCSTGVANMFDQIAPPPASRPARKGAVMPLLAPPSQPASTPASATSLP